MRSQVLLEYLARLSSLRKVIIDEHCCHLLYQLEKKPKELLNYFHLPSDMLLIRIILSNHYLACVISKSIHNIHEMVNVVLSVLIEISVKHDITRVVVFDFRRSAVFWSICKKYSQL